MLFDSRNVHVLKCAEGWAVWRRCSESPIAVYESLSEARTKGMALATREGVEYVEHDTQGRVVMRHLA